MLFRLIPKRPRVARPASRLRNSLKTLLQIVVLWSLALGLIPFVIASFEQSMAWPGFQAIPWCGGVLFVAASSVGLGAANVLVRDGHGTPLPLDTAREFVVAGPYRYVRNPMAMSGILQAVGVGLWLGSPGVIGYAVLGGVLWQYFARPWEEADMEERFGERYRRYRDGVACWIPRLRPYSAAAQANPGGTLQFTPVTEHEFPIVRTLAEAIWRQHYTAIISPEQIDYMLAGRFSDDALRDQLQAPDKWLQILRASGTPVGYCGYELSRENPDALKVGQLYVLESHRGKGLGRFMLGYVEKRARELGRHTLVLQVNKRNTGAIGFYRQAGFEVVREAVFDIVAGFVMDDYVMVKRLA